MFVAETKESASENLDPPKWNQYAYVRYMEKVTEDEIVDHHYVDVRRNARRIWDCVEACNKCSIELYRWTVLDNHEFQCHPYTTGWATIPTDMISHRVLMQPVQHEKLEGYFWLNEAIVESMR